MKSLFALGLFVIALGLGSAASCSVDHATDQLACGTQVDCDPSRACIDGYCVVATGTTCPTSCASCDTVTKTCAIDGTGNGTVKCPSGWNCTITCTTTCREVDCEGAASCTVVCSGTNSCDKVKCGSGRCQIICSGMGSCNDVDCRDSCACDVTCTGAPSCTSTRCPGQCATVPGCQSQTGMCSSC